MMATSDETWSKNLAGKDVGDFALKEFVGAGQIGYVYKASHKSFPETFRAVKLTFDRFREGWEVELAKVMRLGLHVNVVHFHHAGTTYIDYQGQTRFCHYTVWDYIPPGENLKQYLRRTKEIDAGFLLAVVERVLHVLHACEEEGVGRHGDLHAGNILIGDASTALLDEALQRRAPIYISDFGYGATGGKVKPKDDYQGLSRIIDEMLLYVNYSGATPTHRQILRSMKRDMGKLLTETSMNERRPPLELLKVIRDIKLMAQGGGPIRGHDGVAGPDEGTTQKYSSSVGQFQVSEMIGERWDWWKRLFVPAIPARSKIFTLDIPTVVTGPRGCGKTMLFRRLSQRLIVECGDVPELSRKGQIVAFYVNANDFADAFAQFPNNPVGADVAGLICYANLCVLSEFLTVQSARTARFGESVDDKLLGTVQRWLVRDDQETLLVGQDRLEHYRSVVEEVKWKVADQKGRVKFPGWAELSQHQWLPRFIRLARKGSPWLAGRAVLLFVDDFSTPRVSASMQKVLNRLFLQRSAEFLSKVATESWTTFVPQDSSGKTLEDGDDYQLVDIGEESLFLPDGERLAFLQEVFARRLGSDPRVPEGARTLVGLLGRLNLSKTEFARRLRVSVGEQPGAERPDVRGDSQRRGRSRGRVHYCGEDVLAGLWSGDTRMMIQLVSDVIDQTTEGAGSGSGEIRLPVDSSIQDRVFRNRGGEWLNSLTRNEPTDGRAVKAGLKVIQGDRAGYSLYGRYGEHLKAVVEAFAFASTRQLTGPMYEIGGRGGRREVPRMAFRIEILDELRLDGLASEIYRDLIRYGVFMRDSRGKSVRGAFVPRLYLRRLLLPYCTLALSKRDSVALSCEKFIELLLDPDGFQASCEKRRPADGQLAMAFLREAGLAEGSIYDDLEEREPER